MIFQSSILKYSNPLPFSVYLKWFLSKVLQYLAVKAVLCLCCERNVFGPPFCSIDPLRLSACSTFWVWKLNLQKKAYLGSIGVLWNSCFSSFFKKLFPDCVKNKLDSSSFQTDFMSFKGNHVSFHESSYFINSKKMPDHLIVLCGDESLLLFVHVAHLGESFLEPSNLLVFLLYRPAHRVEFRVAEARFRGRCHSTVLKWSNYLWTEPLRPVSTAEKFIFPPFSHLH